MKNRLFNPSYTIFCLGLPQVSPEGLLREKCLTFEPLISTIRINLAGVAVVMDLFAELDQKLETLLSQYESYKQANAELKENLAAKEQALAAKEKALKEAEDALEQITREKEMVRQRIDKILNRLKILDLGEAT